MKTYKHSKKASQRSLVSLSVINVGEQKCVPSYKWGPGVRDHYLIHYIVSGKGTYRVHGETFHLSAGDVFLVLPDTEVEYSADSSDPWTYRWVGFVGTDAAAMVDSTDFSPARPVLEKPAFGPELSKDLRKINESFGSSFRDAVEMTGRLYLALGLFMHRTAAEGIPVDDERVNVRKACEFFDSHYSYDITVREAANYTGVSRSTLYRQFMNALGVSPKQYLDDFRMRKACALLKDTRLTIGSVSASVGIESQFYFTKVFRKSMMMNPTEYRNQRRVDI